MKKLITLGLLTIFCLSYNAQEFNKKGLLAAKGTLAIGSMTSQDLLSSYISANAEFYPHNNASFRGGFYFFLDDEGEGMHFKQNSSLFTEYFYHFNSKSHLDPYIGFGPGLSITQLEPIASTVEPYASSTYKRSLSPVASATIGLNYYATHWSHLFIEAKYVNGRHMSDLPGVSLSEIRFAFGFGFNLFTQKTKAPTSS